MMIYLDAHAHLDHYKDLLPAALAELQHHRIFTISNAVDIASYQRIKEIATQSQWVLPIFGIHPWQAAAHADRLSELDPFIHETPMLGELGLDYLWVDKQTIPAQRTVFEYFLSFAQSQQKVVHLHTKDAEADIMHLLRQYRIKRALIHWYSGPLDILDQLIADDYYFTVGVELFSSAHIQQIAQRIPLDRLLTETDNPGGHEWLAGEVGMPQLVLRVLEQLAGLRRMSRAELAAQVQTNFHRLIGDELWKDWVER